MARTTTPKKVTLLEKRTPLPSAIPPKLFQIDASVRLQIHALAKKQKRLFRPVRREPPRMVDDAVAGKIAIAFSARQDFCNQSGVFFFADEARNLSVGGNAPFRDFRDDGKHFISEIVGQRGQERTSRRSGSSFLSARPPNSTSSFGKPMPIRMPSAIAPARASVCMPRRVNASMLRETSAYAV